MKEGWGRIGTQSFGFYTRRIEEVAMTWEKIGRGKKGY